jgi:hypothetical protein
LAGSAEGAFNKAYGKDAWWRYAGATLHAAQPALEVAGMVATLPLGGGMGMMDGAALTTLGLAGRTAKIASQFSASTIDDAVVYAMGPNKAIHLFAPKHNLGNLVASLGGQRNLVRAVLNAANGKLPSNGVFNNIPVSVGGQTVFIRGSVVNGIPKLGTMFVH